MENKERLVRMILIRSFQYSEEPVFQLASGRMSNYYVNLKPVSWSAEGALLLGRQLFLRARDMRPNAVGGMTMGADPLSLAVAVESARTGEPINAFAIRKEPKNHGLKKLIEGSVAPGDRVVILEDVITTGASTLLAVQRAREAELEVLKIVSVVDREEGGRANIEATGLKVEVLVTLSDIMNMRETLARMEL